MSDEAFIEYPWTATTKENTKVLKFSREDVLSNAVALFEYGDSAAKGDSDAERAAWRAATKRGVRKLLNEFRGGKVRMLVQEAPPPRETYTMRNNGAQHIPSELLEPIYAGLIGVWFEQVQNQKMAPQDFEQRLWALSAVASEAAATHCVMVVQNHIGKFRAWVEKLKEQDKKNDAAEGKPS